MKTTTRLFPLFILSMQAALVGKALAADADSPNAVDTSDWKCKYCAFEEGTSGYVEGGIGYVSTDSYKFGEYTGLNEEGVYALLGAGVRVRGDEASYWNIDANNLGLDTRSLAVEGGKQGRYKITLKYDELPHYISDSVATPFLGAGTGSLTLPGTWVRAGTTAGMTDLANSLHPENLEASRKRVGIGVSWLTEKSWEYAVNVRHETKEGTQRTAGSFFFSTAQLVLPVDTVTNQIDASASYTGKTFQARLAYYGSMFSNNLTALNWQNPYSTGPTGPDAGQLALPPDNQFHQFLVALGYQFTDKTRGTADIAYGRMTQDQAYLAATVNTNLASPALPAPSLGGQVDTLNASLKVTSSLTDRLRLNASYVYNDHADKTPQASYTWVSTDILVSPTPRTNTPYSFTQNVFKLSGDYRFATRSKVSLGADLSSMERTYQEVSKNSENTFWVRGSTRAWEYADLTLKAAHGDRSVNNYEVLPWVSPVENSLMRKYNMADRTRDTVGARADFMAWQVLNFGLGYDYANDDYSKSQIGLTASKDVTYTADASALVAKKTSVHAYYTRETIDSLQNGSSSATTPDWRAENSDVIDTAGIGFKHTLLAGKFDLGMDYTVSNARGSQIVYDGIAAPAFPDVVTRLAAVKLHATYRMSNNLTLKGTYWYEHLNSENWHLDGVDPATISNVLGFGEQPPSYYVNVLMMSVRYKF